METVDPETPREIMLHIGTLTLKNRLFMAPMAGITNLPFRRMAKRLGAGLVATEMISAVGLARCQQKTLRYLQSNPEERPLSVQIFGNDPAIMAEACRMVVDAGADLVDINMGCPARKVLKTGSGGALLRSLDRVRAIVSAMRTVCPIPLTVKMRAGWSSDQPVASRLAQIVEDCGADAITLHPRFVTQRFSGEADWRIIEQVKARVRIPVIGNGDIRHPVQAIDMRRQTGCDGVMIGRAAVGNPWIFKQIQSLEAGRSLRLPDWRERREAITTHFDLLMDLVGEESAARLMRGLLVGYTKGLPHTGRFRAAFTEIRDRDMMLTALRGYGSLMNESPESPGAASRDPFGGNQERSGPVPGPPFCQEPTGP